MKCANILISIVAFFTVFFCFCGFAIDFSMLVAARAQLQTAAETVALAAVADIKQGSEQTTAAKVLKYTKINGIKYAQIDEFVTKPEKNALYVKLSAPAQTYFLSALGITNIKLQAQSAAIIEPYLLEADKDFSLENHLQFTSPVLIMSKPGDELEITSSNDTLQYLVFVGLKDRNNETKWVDITCSSNDFNAKTQYFDLDADCIKERIDGAVSAAGYIRIVNNTTVPSVLEIETLNLTNIAKLIQYSKFKTL